MREKKGVRAVDKRKRGSEILDEDVKQSAQPWGERDPDSLYGRIDRFSRSDSRRISLYPGSVVHCPHGSQFREIRLVQIHEEGMHRFERAVRDALEAFGRA